MAGAQLTGAIDRYDLSTNVKEDLHDTISLVSREETPFQSSIGKVKVKNNYFEWLSDTLASPSTSNAQIDGFTFTPDSSTIPLRMANYCQISAMQVRTTRRADTVDAAGRKSEMARLITKRGVELRKDIEAILLNKQAASVGTATAAPTTAGYPGFIKTNDSRGASGADPTWSGSTQGHPSNVASIDGTDRALSETYIKNVIRGCYTAGGRPSIIMMSPTVKQRFSEYMFTSSARIATPYQDHGANKKSGLSVVGAVDVYVSDFGAMDIVVNPTQPRDDDVFIYDPEYWAVGWLTPITLQELGKVGDSNDKMLVADYCLVAYNEASSGIVADVDETLAMIP